MKTLVPQAPGSPGDEDGECHHPKNGPGGEGEQVGDRGRGGRQGQRREDSKKVGTSSQAVERANPHSGVRVSLSR